MSGRSSHWRRPVTKMYDYNYNLGEHYYRPQLNYVGNRRAASPPKARTFAERFAADPVYGSYGIPSYRYSKDLAPPPSPPARIPSPEPMFPDKSRLPRGSMPPKYMSLDDLRFDEPPTRLKPVKKVPDAEDPDDFLQLRRKKFTEPDEFNDILQQRRKKFSEPEEPNDFLQQRRKKFSEPEELNDFLQQRRKKFSEPEELSNFLQQRQKKLTESQESNDFLQLRRKNLPPKLSFGNRRLESPSIPDSPKTAGALMESRRSMDPFSDEGFFSSKKPTKRVTLPSSADSDMMIDDPWNKPYTNKSMENLSATRKRMESKWNEMKQESEETSSRFRAKVTTRRQQVQRRMEDSDDEDMLALTSKADKIQQRVKARLAQLEEEFPDVPIGMAARGRTPMKNLDMEDSGVKSVRMNKRSVNMKATYEM